MNKPLLQQAISACLVWVYLADGDKDIRVSAPYKKLEELFASGEQLDPNIPAYSNTDAPDLLSNLEAEYLDALENGDVAPDRRHAKRMGQVMEAIFELAAYHGWRPNLSEDSVFSRNEEVNIQEAIILGTRRALSDISATYTDIHKKMDSNRLPKM